MRKYLSLCVIAFCLFCSCAGSKRVTGAGDADAALYRRLLPGKWSVISMKRDPGAPAEQLAGVTLSFGTDSSFAGKAPCNSIAGTYTLNGPQIRLGQIISTEMACPFLEQESHYLRLLENNISRLSVTADKLLLRDDAGNLLLEGVREN